MSELKRHEFPEPKVCPNCTYTTKNRGGWSVHQKLCKHRPTEADHEKDQLRERVISLEQQLAARDEQLAAKDAEISLLIKEISTELTRLRKSAKRKDRYAEVTANRRPRTEPERREIAQSQQWRCANPDGGCLLPGELREYDIDHVVPMWKGGVDEPENLQALCPACHRRKTNRERVERSVGVATTKN